MPVDEPSTATVATVAKYLRLITRARCRASAHLADSTRGVCAARDGCGGLSAERHHRRLGALPEKPAARRRPLAIGAPSRAPHESSSFQTTATALRVLQVYAPASRRAEYEGAGTGRRGVGTNDAPNNRRPTFPTLWLALGGCRQRARSIGPRANLWGGSVRMVAGRIAVVGERAYATGQVLTALRESRALRPTARCVPQSVRFLMDTQLADGSWYVRAALGHPAVLRQRLPAWSASFISAAATIGRNGARACRVAVGDRD